MSSVFNSVLQVEKSSSLKEAAVKKNQSVSSVFTQKQQFKKRETDTLVFHACVDFHRCHRDCISSCSPDTVDKSVHELAELFTSAALADTAGLI